MVGDFRNVDHLWPSPTRRLAPAVVLDLHLEGAAPGTQPSSRFPDLPAIDTFGPVSLDTSNREGRSAHWTPNARHGFQTFRDSLRNVSESIALAAYSARKTWILGANRRNNSITLGSSSKTMDTLCLRQTLTFCQRYFWYQSRSS